VAALIVARSAPAGTPHPPPPGMGKADRLGQRVPLSLVHFSPTESSLRHCNASNVPLFPPHFALTESTFRRHNVAQSERCTGNVS
jgi:hypothetical protein